MRLFVIAVLRLRAHNPSASPSRLRMYNRDRRCFAYAMRLNNARFSAHFGRPTTGINQDIPHPSAPSGSAPLFEKTKPTLFRSRKINW